MMAVGGRRGQSMVEYAVLIGAAALGIFMMSGYVFGAFGAHAKVMEEELNGAVLDNRP
jgi:hypothetical protein